MNNLLLKWNQVSLVKRILAGLIVGGVLALTIPDKMGFYFWIIICRGFKGSCTNISSILSHECPI